MSIRRIKCKNCNELVNDKSSHFCTGKRTYVNCDSDAFDFSLSYAVGATVGEVFTDSQQVCDSVVSEQDYSCSYDSVSSDSCSSSDYSSSDSSDSYTFTSSD